MVSEALEFLLGRFWKWIVAGYVTAMLSLYALWLWAFFTLHDWP